MNLAFQIERQNPASYLSWLSQDVVHHYLINQYALFWLKDFSWEVTTVIRPDVSPVVPVVPTTLGVTSWKNIQAVFTSDGLVQLSQGHSGKKGPFFSYQDKHYVYCAGSTFIPDSTDLFGNLVYVFGADFQYEGIFAEQIQEIFLVSEYLILLPLPKKADETQVIIYGPTRLIPRELTLPLGLSQIRFRYIGYGLIMLLSHHSSNLHLFDVETGELIRQLDLSALDISLPVLSFSMTSSGQISLITYLNQLIVFTPK